MDRSKALMVRVVAVVVAGLFAFLPPTVAGQCEYPKLNPSDGESRAQFGITVSLYEDVSFVSKPHLRIETL